jgi:hypothetical protein
MKALQELVQSFFEVNFACSWSTLTSKLVQPNPFSDSKILTGLFQTLREFFCLGQDEVKSES